MIDERPSPRVVVFGLGLAGFGAALLLAPARLDVGAPVPRWWAFDHLRDTPLWIRVALASCGFAAVWPPLQIRLRALGARAGRFALARLAGLPSPLRIACALALVAAVFALLWWLRQRNLALGDSAHLTRILTMYVHAEGYHVTYDEPLDLYLHSITYRLVHEALGWAVEDAYALLSCAAGIGYLAVAIALWRRCSLEALRVVCALGLVVSTASVQLFFGYVENYTLVALALVAYAWLAREALAGRIPVGVAAFVLGLGLSLHVLAGWFLPSLVYLWWVRAGSEGAGRSLRSLAIAGGALLLPIVATVALLTAIGVPLGSVRDTHLAHLKFIFLTEPGTPQYRYAAYSPEHLRDLANEIALVSLPGLAALAGALLAAARRVDWRDPYLRFLGLCALLAHAFAAVWNPEITAYRDWDLFAISGFFDALLGAYVLVRFVPRSADVLGVALPVIVLALGLTGSWVVSNATRIVEVPSEHDRAHVRAGHLQRRAGNEAAALREYAEALAIEPRNADALYELGSAQWNAGEPEDAEPWLRRFLAVESESERARAVRGALEALARPQRSEEAGALPPPSPGGR